MSFHLAPSLLSANFAYFERDVRVLESAGADYLHFDVMDGRFVPNITFGTHPLKALRPFTNAVFDVHLMIVEPEKFVEQFVSAGAQIVTVHVEATTHLQRTLALIRSCGARAGVALNPSTPLDHVKWVLDDIDQLLVMTVNPGFSGQVRIPAMQDKVRQARRMLESHSRTIDLEIDGGIDATNVSDWLACGANVVVAGQGVFGHPEGPGAGVKGILEAGNGILSDGSTC